MRIRKRPFFEVVEPYLYLLPTLILLSTFVFYPFIKTIVGSFFAVNMYGAFVKWIGLKNYQRIFTDPGFYTALGNTLKHLVMVVPATIGVSLFLALLTDKKSRFSKIYETLFCLTMAVSSAVAAKIFQMLYNPTLGIINAALGINIHWLTDKNIALIALTIIIVWIDIGFGYIYLTAAIRNVPGDIIESADVEGANLPTKVFKIIIPMISPSLFYLFCTNSVAALIMVRLVIIMTQGGPGSSTETLIFRMYNFAYNNSNYSAAYAMGVVVFLLVLAIMIANFMFEKKGVVYE